MKNPILNLTKTPIRRYGPFFTIGALCRISAAIFLLFITLHSVHAQTSVFSYQGTLANNGSSANGSFDLQFKLFDALSGGTQQGSPVTKNAVAVSNGTFAVTLDFGSSVFSGANRFLEISAQTAGGPGFTTLSPRSPVLSTPYSIQAGTAGFATSAGSAQGISGPLTTNNPTAGLTVTNNALGVANPDINNLPPAGLKAESTATNDQTAGIIGISNSNYGTGVIGITKGSAQPGNVGLQTVGVVGFATSTFGPANGIRGETASAAGWGVHGVADSTTGAGNGVVGETYSPNGAAFFGRSFGTGDLIRLANDSPIGLNPRFRVTSNGTLISTANITTTGNMTAGGTIRSGGTPTEPNFSVELDGFVNTKGGISSGRVTGMPPTFVVLVSGDVQAAGTISSGGKVVPVLGGNSSTNYVCRISGNELGGCSAPLQIKTNVSSFASGLDLIKRLRPISFDWKDGGVHDLGLGTEDVAAIEPLLITRNEKGEVEGVKYDRIGVVLINAVKEQQTLIEAQDAKIKSLESQLDSFKTLVCSQNPSADICRPKK